VLLSLSRLATWHEGEREWPDLSMFVLLGRFFYDVDLWDIPTAAIENPLFHGKKNWKSSEARR
jgi:hypothetical protein